MFIDLLSNEKLENLQNLARAKGGILLTTHYTDAKTKYKWQCKEGHLWLQSGRSIEIGLWCAICTKTNIMEPLERYQYIASLHNGKCLNTTYLDSRTPHTWQCQNGHTWEALGFHVAAGSWCPFCTGHLRLDGIGELQKIANEKNGKLLSTTYTSTKAYYMVECAQKHQWSVQGAQLKAGTWCPVCSRGLNERKLHYVAEKLLGIPFQKTRPAWLTNTATNSPLELDCYNNEWQIALEYNGAQHYAFVKSWHYTQKEFKKQQQRDELKRELCAKHKVLLIEVPYTVMSSEFATFIATKLSEAKEHKLPRLQNVDNLIVPDQIGKKHTLQYLNELAAMKHGTCLNTEYLGMPSNYQWRCELDHIWTAKGSSIQDGTWCPVCAGAKIDKPLEKMSSHAQKCGGTLLSTSYVNLQTKYRWQCSQGHQWDASYINIRNGAWCQQCVGNNKIQRFEKLRLKAAEYNYALLDTVYTSVETEYTLKCAKGHIWKMQGKRILAGRLKCKKCETA